MIVTINTDASYHSIHRVGAFAFWIVCNRGRVLNCGALKNEIKGAKTGATEAEVQSIINAIYTLKKQQWDNITKVIINTDSTNAIAILTKNIPEIQKWKLQWGGPLRDVYNKIKVNLPEIEFRHIKAHKTTDTAKSWVNDWCDKKAKEMLWTKINSNK